MWGTICANHWDLRDADVVCRQLGYEGALSASPFRYPAFGQNTRQIWFSEVNCAGNETSISECRHLVWEGHCWHYFDAGVVCRPTSKRIKHLSKESKKFSSILFFICSFELMCNSYYQGSFYCFLIKFIKGILRSSVSFDLNIFSSLQPYFNTTFKKIETCM